MVPEREDVRGGHPIFVIFLVPYRSERRCSFRVLKRKPKVWFLFHLNKFLGRPYAHCCVSINGAVRNVNLFSDKPKWYSHIKFLHHPALGAVVMLRSQRSQWLADLVNEIGFENDKCEWSCVTDVCRILQQHGIETNMCPSPSGLFQQLKDHYATEQVLVHARVRTRTDPAPGRAVPGSRYEYGPVG